MCDAVKIPVIAAGGIADGRGMAAAFMLGAAGIQMGTRFMVAKECTVHQNYNNRILSAKDIDTILTGKHLGHPVRCLKNELSRAIYEKEYDMTVTNDELECMGTGALRRASVDDEIANSTIMAGQTAAMVTKEKTSREIISEIMSEAEQLLKGAVKWVE